MEDKKLKKQLSSRHITMLALGGAIGAGLFKGSGEAIGIAGPSVLIAFLIGALKLLQLLPFCSCGSRTFQPGYLFLCWLF